MPSTPSSTIVDTVWIVTRTFHHDGMDQVQTETLGTYASLEAAQVHAILEDCRFSNIAFDTEIEEAQVEPPEAVVKLDEDLRDDLLEEFTESPDKLTPAVEAALDMTWPEWRQELAERQDEA